MNTFAHVGDRRVRVLAGGLNDGQHIFGMSATRAYVLNARSSLLKVGSILASSEISIFGELTLPVPYGSNYLSEPDGLEYVDVGYTPAPVVPTAPIASTRIGTFVNFAPNIVQTVHVTTFASTTYDNFFLQSDVIRTLN